MKSLTAFLITRNDGYNEENRGIKYRPSLQEIIEDEIDNYNKFLKDRPFEHSIEIQKVIGKNQYSKVLAKIVNGREVFKATEK